jgi:glycosyltransferase involved in cell wall biosynthesis
VGGTDTEFGQQVLAQAKAQATAQQSGHPRVHFLGYRGDVQRILPAFDAYAVSSRREAFSLSIVEAFAAQLACVATRVGGIPEAVEDGRTGLLVPVDDALAMGAALACLSQDAALRQTLATQARQRYLERYTDARMTQATLAIYQRVLAEARA